MVCAFVVRGHNTSSELSFPVLLFQGTCGPGGVVAYAVRLFFAVCMPASCTFENESHVHRQLTPGGPFYVGIFVGGREGGGGSTC